MARISDDPEILQDLADMMTAAGHSSGGGVGEDGPTGPQGPIGPTGPQGEPGAAGATGPTGPTGPEGPEGPQGPAGADGAQGPQGLQGPAGADGAVGAAGSQGIQGIQGIQGLQGLAGPIGNTGVSTTGVVASKTADQPLIGTAFADVTSTGLAVAANTSYAFEFQIIADADAVTTGIDISVNGPASPTSINYTVTYWTSATVTAKRPFSVYDGNTASTGSNGATRAVYTVKGVLRNGANAGTLVARAKREAVGTGPNVRAGSHGFLIPLS